MFTFHRDSLILYQYTSEPKCLPSTEIPLLYINILRNPNVYLPPRFPYSISIYLGTQMFTFHRDSLILYQYT